MALRQFTVAPRRLDPCPHQCSSWARTLLPGGGDCRKPDGEGHLHNPNCPPREGAWVWILREYIISM